MPSSVFSGLDAPPEHVVVQQVSRARLLPRCCGTYAFYDREGALLYIGKAKNLRARVLSHFRRAGDATLLLPPWTNRVVRVEARCARSEMEALLVEAELIARLRPSCNRQMRSWERYCYLLPTGNRAAPLTISCQLQPWKPCFGPYRTRRQAVGIIEAVFRLVIRNGDAHLLTKCYRLLRGEDDSLILDLERQCQDINGNAHQGPWSSLLPQLTETLRKAFQRAALLRRAGEVLRGAIFMPRIGEEKTVAVITEHGLRLKAITPYVGSAEAFLATYRELCREKTNAASTSLPKAVSDCLCVAVRQMSTYPHRYPFLPSDQVLGLSASDLIALGFGKAESVTSAN